MWDSGLGRLLLAPILDCFDRWQLTLTGLYTFPNSAKHLHLYQQFGFWPRFLTAIMSRPVDHTERQSQWGAFSNVAAADRQDVLSECFDLTHSVYPGLRLDREIQGVDDQGLGETVLIRSGAELDGIAVCQCGYRHRGGRRQLLYQVCRCAARTGCCRAVRPASGRLRATGEIQRAVAASGGCEPGARTRPFEPCVGRAFARICSGYQCTAPTSLATATPMPSVIDDWR